MMEPTPGLTSVNPESQTASDAKSTLVRGLGLLDSVLLLVSGIFG